MGRNHLWTPEEVALLGTMSDEKVAHRVGLSVRTVFVERNARNIPPSQIHSKPVVDEFWTSEMIALLGKEPEIEIAKKLGVGRYIVNMKRRMLGIPPYERLCDKWTPDVIELLGKMSDAKLGRLIGANRRTVKAKRESLGIPANQGRCQWTAEMVALLGTAPDFEISKQIGLKEDTVAYARRSRGIAPWKSDTLSLIHI